MHEDVTIIDLNGQTTVVMNAANAHNRTIQATGGGNYTIVDTVANLSTSNTFAGTNAADVIANVQNADKTISDTTLHADVTKVDLNGQTGVVMNKANVDGRTIQATGGGNYTVVDTVANLASITITGTNAADVIANVQSGDKTISDTTLDTDVTKIDLNGQEGVVMNKANAHNRTIQATGGGNYTIVDTVANLASITLAGTTASDVIANVQNGDKTISDTTLDSDVTIIDLNGQTTVVMDAANAHNRTIQATGGGNYTIVDTVANLSSSNTFAGTAAANVIANVQGGDKTISDTTLHADVTIIDLNAQTTVVMDAANAHNRTIQATGGGNYTIVDTVANLSTSNTFVGTNAANVIANVQNADKTISDTTLHADVTKVDLNAQTGVVMDAANADNRTIQATGGGNYTIVDTVANLATNTRLLEQMQRMLSPMSKMEIKQFLIQHCIQM